LPKKKDRKADTIKIASLSADTIKEFAPKDDSVEEDRLWEEYFRGRRSVPAFLSKRSDVSLPFQDEEGDPMETSLVGHPAAITTVTTVTKPSRSKVTESAVTKEELVALGGTHTESEQMVYSVMYRDTISKGKEEEYFSLRKLMKKTGIGSDKTVFNALKGLRNKMSIRRVRHSNNRPIGTLYKILTPREIFRLRNDMGMVIDVNSRRIVIPAGTDTTIATAVPNVGTDSLSISTGGTSVDEGVSYIGSRDRINKGGRVKSAASLLNNNRLKDDDMIFNHKASTISLYKRYTGNQWRIGDDEFYAVVKEILIEVIEAAIISSILRAKATISSFAYCEGTIDEFKNNLPPGYLGYLRGKWEETLKRGSEIRKTVKASNKQHTKREGVGSKRNSPRSKAYPH
jgi:hypothetical protein